MTMIFKPEPPFMECGHVANATVGDDRRPACVICWGSKAVTIASDTNVVDLTGRTSQCCYCKKTTPSSRSLAFFQHRPDQEYDDHYDGCRGWD